LRSTIDRVFRDLSKRERNFLYDISQSGFSASDASATILGLDLWRDELLVWRNSFATESTRPSMWQFAFGPSAAWETSSWRALPLEARVVRARLGSLAHEVLADGLVRIGLPASGIERWLTVLRTNGFAVGAGTSLHFPRIASPDELAVDLALVVIITHWFGMCAVADRVADEASTREVEVYGYPGTCRFCRARWMIAPNERWSLPPFHPACRCFAQPAYR
jgi:hypothetical protein